MTPAPQARCNREYMKRRRAAARAEGNCQNCLKREAMPGQSRCGYCADQQDAYKASRKEAKP